MQLVASIIGCGFQGLIMCLSMTISRAPGSNVADSLDGTYSGPFKSYSAKGF